MEMDLVVSKLIFNVAIMFIMMIPGVILRKCKMIPDGFSKGVSNLVLYIAQPALILYAYISCTDRDILIDALVVLLVSTLTHIIFAVVAFITFAKNPDGKRRLLRLATIFANAAFMGVPLISAIYAGTPLAGRATIFASVYNFTFNIFLWSLGVFICTNKRDDNNDGILDPHIIERKKSAPFIKAIAHPVTVAALFGFVVIVFNLRVNAPQIFGDESLLCQSLSTLSGLVAPLSMVVIGLRLSDVNFKNFFNDFYMYVCFALRHFVLPLAVIGTMLLLRLIGIPVTREVFLVCLILAATPSASSSTMFAEKFDCDAAYVNRIVVVSTLLSIISMPLMLLIASGVA